MRKFNRAGLATVVMAALLGSAAFGGPAAAQDKPYKFDIIVHDGSTSFYAPVKTGMDIACKQLGADCSFMGPPNGSDVVAEVDLAQNAINSGVDAIITDVPDKKAMQKIVSQAAAKGVDVYFIGTPYPDEPYGSIGQNFYAAGTTDGKQIVKYMPDGGKVGFVTSDPGNIPLSQRAQGAIDVLKKAGNFQIVGPVAMGNDDTQAYGAIESMYEANPDMKGIFGTDKTDVIARFIQKDNLHGKVIGGGFDLFPATLAAIKAGDIKFTTGQNPFMWGYLSIHQVYLHKAFGLQPISVDAGANIVDASNVDAVNPKYE